MTQYHEPPTELEPADRDISRACPLSQLLHQVIDQGMVFSTAVEGPSWFRAAAVTPS